MSTETILVGSTVNVLPTTMDLIENGQIGVATMAGSFGAFIAVLDDAELERKIVHEVDLYPLFDLAREKGCTWVYLDRDADPLEGVPDYDDVWI